MRTFKSRKYLKCLDILEDLLEVLVAEVLKKLNEELCIKELEKVTHNEDPSSLLRQYQKLSPNITKIRGRGGV